MAKDIRVVIIENDPFSRNWMALLCARDWRTRVVAELDRPNGFHFLQNRDAGRVDLVLFDVESPEGTDAIPPLWEVFSSLVRPPVMLCTGLHPKRTVLKHVSHPGFGGYLLKEEINSSIAWAVSMAVTGWRVVTPGTYDMAISSNALFPRPLAILDGRRSVRHLTEHQSHAARLAVLFSMERRELANELAISEEWGYGLVREVYKHLGLKELLQEDVDPREFLGNNELILASYQKIKGEFQGAGKARDMETLAFHLLTMPLIEEVK